MYEPTIVTWIIVSFGLITCLPLLGAQLVMLVNPKGKLARDLMIGKGEEWRDGTHFKASYALALADWIIFAPLFMAGIVGIYLGTSWAYLFLAVSGAIQLYINIFLWSFEKEFVYPAQGPLKYYTFIWGNFMYWSIAALIYGLIRLQGIFL